GVAWSDFLIDRRCFFFSSRRRHTRLQGDWSSDVCSSDLFDLIQGEEHNIVMVQFLRPDEIAQPQPELVDEVYLIPRQVRGVRTEKEELVLTLGRKDFQVKRGPRIRQPFPRKAELAGLFGEAHLR